MKNPDGREPSRVEMYIITHKPKSGNPVNDNTNRIVDKIHHLEKTAKRKAKYEKLQKDMEIQRDGRGQRNNSAAALVVV
ncbi:hypothetical protein QL285_082780 [Trifolium repens]|nr:hypothetical protein QL285_082780 [Trifolium repens]